MSKVRKRFEFIAKIVIPSIVLSILIVGGIVGCSAIKSKINDIKGSLIGNGYNIYT